MSQFLTKSPRSYNSVHGSKFVNTGFKTSFNATIKNQRAAILEESNQ